MPIDIRVDGDERVRYSLGSGVVTDADILEAYERVVGDPAFDPILDVIADTRGVERVEVTAKGIRNLAARYAREERLRATEARVAIVAATAVLFGLGRMYAAYVDQQVSGRHFLVCRTIEEARAWLTRREGPLDS